MTTTRKPTWLTIPQHQIDALASNIQEAHASSGYTNLLRMRLGIQDGLGNILVPNAGPNARVVYAYEDGKPPEVVDLPPYPLIPLRNDPSLEAVEVMTGYPPGQTIGQGRRQIISMSHTLASQVSIGANGVTPFESEHNQLASVLFTSQPANWLFAAPDVAALPSGGQPGFRRLLNNDLALSATTGQALIAGASAPSWSALALNGGASIVSGVLPLVNGGAGSNLSATGPGYLQQATNGANVTLLKSNLTAIVAPAVTDDGAHGYGIGSQWVDTVGKKAYVLVDASTGAAVWDSTTTGSLLTAKGDLLTYSTTDIRLAVGANNTVLVADSAQATGNKWSASLTGLTLDNGNTITLKDTLFTLQDDGDATKQLVFQLSGISPSTTRTLTAPNASGTIALTATTGQGYVMIAPTATADNLIAGATTTIDLLTLKTTDDNTTKVALRVLSSAAATVASVGATGLAVFAGINSTPIGATTPSTVAATTIKGIVATATNIGLILQSSDNNVTNSILQTEDSSGNKMLYANADGSVRIGNGTVGGILVRKWLSQGGFDDFQITHSNSPGTNYIRFQNAGTGITMGDVGAVTLGATTLQGGMTPGATHNAVWITADATNAYIFSLKYASSPYPPLYIAAPTISLNTKLSPAWADLNNYGTTALFIDGNQNVGIGVSSSLSNRLTVIATDTATATVTNVAVVGHNTSGSPVVAGYGTGVLLQGQDASSPGVNMARWRTFWNAPTHLSRAATVVLSAYGTSEQDALTIVTTTSGTIPLIGVGTVSSPSAYLHLPAGAAAASSAPLKLNSGTSLTSAEAGAVEFTTDDLFFTITTGPGRKRLLMADPSGGLTSGKIPVATTNGRLQDGPAYDGTTLTVTKLAITAGSGSGTPKVGGSLFAHHADVGNTTVLGADDDLYSDTVPASTLATNDDMLEVQYGGTFASSATATREVKVWFGGTAIFDTGTLTLSLSSAWTAYVTIIRVSATVVRYMVSLTTEGAALAAYTAVGELTGLTLSNTNVLKITGAANGVGAAANDIVAKVGSVAWCSAP